MPHDSAHIYRDTVNNIGVDFRGDVGAFFGVNSGDEATLCKLEDIKPAAKNKPFRHSSKLPTLADMQDKYFGFDVNPCGPNGNIANFIAKYPTEWTYLKPRGYNGGGAGVHEHYRARDFDGYYDDVNYFVYPNGSTFPRSYTVGRGGSGVDFTLSVNMGNNLKTGSISVEDFKFGGSGSENPTFGNCYFGLLFVQGSTFRKIITASATINSAATTTIHIAESGGELSGLTTSQTYTVYPIISRFSRTSLTNFSNQDAIIALPLIGAFSFQVKSPQMEENIGITAASAYMGLRARLYYDFDIAHSPDTNTITVQWYVYTASGPDDRTGTLLDSGSEFFSASTSVTGQKNTTNPGWLRIYCEKQNVSSVNAETFIQVSEIPPED